MKDLEPEADETREGKEDGFVAANNGWSLFGWDKNAWKTFFKEAVQPWKDTCAQTFVKAFDSISVKNMVLGEAFAIGTHAVFVSDAGADGSDDLGQVIAHEIGHALGLNHNANGINGQPGCPGVTLSNDQPANPFIDYANGDSDATDESKPLMWCKSGGDHTHLGSPAWFQLNQANPVGP